MKTKRIALWSGPRNISTALMYSFGNRKDTKVLDEPLFGYFLKHTGVDRPSRKEVLEVMETDADTVINETLNSDVDKPVLFMKHMANHLIDLDKSFIDDYVNVVLTRDPKDMLLSYSQNVEHPTLLDTAYQQQVELIHYLKEKGITPVVVDSKDVLLDPETVLSKLCAHCDIPFTNEMLSWKAGKRKEDGVWEKYWYHSVHKSTGFNTYKEKTEELPGHLKALYNECLPLYQELTKYKIN